tara:strand:+ start:1331 stop:1963 length:633 start_codon:yes stop_codon:yes gene_type:complete
MKMIQPRLAKHLQRQAWLLSMLAILSFNVLAEEVQAEQEASIPQSMVSPTEQTVVEENTVPDEQVSLSVEQLKKQVIKLNRDLFILEEDLLFPANTQLVVYLSFATGKFLNMDSISLKVDDEIVAAHLYTERQLEALKRGGMQRLFMGNLKTGEHEVTAVLHGIGPNKEDYKIAASKKIKKGTELTALEIRIEDQSQTYQPRVTVIEWEE